MGKILKKDQVDNELDLESRLNFDETPQSSDLIQNQKVISAKTLPDLEQSQSIVQKAQAEAQKIKERAKKLYEQVEDKINQAKQQGFDQGREEGLQSVTELLAKVKLENEKIAQNLEKEVLNLVYEIAEKVIGDALQASDAALISIIKQALNESLGKELVILLHPEDYEKIKKNESQLLSSLHGSQKMILKPVETVKKGGCVIESELGTIDAQLQTQLEAIKRVLLEE